MKINIDLGFLSLRDLAKRWKLSERDVLELGVLNQLTIWNARDLRENPTANSLPVDEIAKIFNNRNTHIDPMREISPLDLGFNPISVGLIYALKKDQPTLPIGEYFAVTTEEVERFEIENSNEKNYPKELQIALKIWRKVFSRGITPHSSPLSKHDMVRRELEPYKFKDAVVKRICYIVTTKGSNKKITEATVTEYNRNVEGHPHYAPLLEIAVKLWEECKTLKPYKTGAKKWLELFHPALKTNQTSRILELTNPNPEGGRPKKGD